jgi:CBS domain-containing protein
MTWIPDSFRQLAEQIVESGEPLKTTPRGLISLYTAQRRGRWISSQIRGGLKEFGLTTVPDFETAYIDGEIEIALLQPRNPIVEAKPAVQDEAVEAAPAVLAGGSVSDPVARVRMLQAANRVPISVKRDNPITEATTLMLLNDFSQLPVMGNERDVYGLVSWRSIGTARAYNRPCECVRDVLDEAPEVWDDAPLLDAITIITERAAVLVRQRSDRKIIGLVTTSDLSLEFRTLAEPFLLLGEIENHLRRLVDGKFSLEAIEAAKNPGDPERQIEDVSDLTFGEYIRLLENEENWKVFGYDLDRKSICAQLEKIRRIRNDVMHFSPDGVSEDNLNLLRDMVKFLQLV